MTIDTNNVKLRREELSTLATRQQRMAANPKKSVWVGASAGTGKTKVLSDRVLRLLLLGVNASKILCLTYTKAAAVEMNARVADKLGKWAVSDDASLEKELIILYGKLPENKEKLKSRARQLFATLLDTPGGIKIQTIHSFCQEILKRFPLEADISPYFDVMDDRSSLEAINNIKTKILIAAGNNPDSEIGQAMSFITDNISEYGFSDVINHIIENRSKIAGLINFHGGKEKLLLQISQKLGVNDNENEEKIIKGFFDECPLKEIRELIRAGKEELAPWADGSADINDYEKYTKIFLTSSNGLHIRQTKIGIKKNTPAFEIFTKEGERCLALIEKIKALHIYQNTKAILLLASELIKGYDEFKHNHAKMDYDDMIMLTRNLLENKDTAKWVLYKLDGGIDNILIDEAQDTSPDQWAIIRSISDEFFTELDNSEKPRTIFAVGDRKQSIYSFQGADPDKFDEMCDYFSTLTPDFEKVNLDISFRSTPAVLTAVNSLFSDDKIRNGVTSKNEHFEHIPFRTGDAGEVEFWEMIEPEEEKEEALWIPPIKRAKKTSTSSQMAKMIASKIKQMVSSGEILQSKQRPVQYSDFLILVRSRGAFCEEFIRECKNLNINISGIDRIKLMEQIAVQDLVSLGKFLLMPEDDLSLAEVLKSPLFGLDDNDLFELCYQRKSSLWSSLLENKKYSEISDKIKFLFNNVDFMRPFELYNFILSKMNGRKKYYERMGEEAEDGINEFINLSLIFEQEHIPTLQYFIEWITSDDVEIKRELEQGKNNMVRIMTVHGSKGLQAPIVILPDTTKIPQNKRSADILWDDDIFVYPPSGNDYNALCDKLNEQKKEKMMEEYRRLMYVAVTRAEDRMIFCGFRKKNKPSEDSWYNLFKNSFTKIATFDENNKIWSFSNKQEMPVDKKQINAVFDAQEKIPDFMYISAPAESPLSKPLTPSRPEDEPAIVSPLTVKNNNVFYKRGTLIHKLLQFIPEISPEKRQDKILAFLKRKAPDFSNFEIEKIADEITSLLENKQFGNVFGKNSKAEVPLMGVVNNKIISGQIDRLVIENKKIIIVDFKTNRQPAATRKEVPAVYISQLEAYKMLLNKIYPDYEIKSYILWTNTANMMEI